MSEPTMRDIHGLARLAIDVLDAQKRYFKTRAKDDLIESKRLEKELRGLASSYLEVETL